MVLGLTSVSVFPQLYIDQCSLLQKHILDLGVSAYFFPSHPGTHSRSSQYRKINKKICVETAASRAMFKTVIMDSRKRKTALSFGSVYLFCSLLTSLTEYILVAYPNPWLRQFCQYQVSICFCKPFCKPLEWSNMTLSQDNCSKWETDTGRLQEIVSRNSPQRLSGSNRSRERQRRSLVLGARL